LPQPSMSCPIGTRPTIVRYCQDYNRVPISSGALGCLGRHRTQDEEPLRLYSEFSQQVRSQTQVALRVLCRQVSAVPGGTWHQWEAYDVPADRTTLPEGAGRAGGKEALKHAVNDFGRPGYGGPCPPRGHGPHHYHFRLLALSTDRLPVRKDPSCRD